MSACDVDDDDDDVNMILSLGLMDGGRSARA